jgi:membrane-bound metal-dependent hydrolase YbcI (DUF457 family)
MAGFKTHITTSTVVGIGYGIAGHYMLELSPPTCLLAGGLCSVSGMLPDLDSASGIPARETIAFAAAIIPMLLAERMESMGIPRETMAVVAGGVYLGIRFGIGSILKKFTVHRGMFHSLPAAAIAGLITFLICQSQSLDDRYFKSAAVVLGFMTHLILDEIWSIGFQRGRIYLKSSFGTAIKFRSHHAPADMTAYSILIVLGMIAYQDHEVLKGHSPQRPPPVAESKQEGFWR